ncbi:ubiquitin protein ligase [Aureococcus anophagefferens]|nr:ubiquitin protein ligase [Aureococcus anophagefferens]
MNTKFVKLLALSLSCSLVAGVPPGSRALQRGRRDDDDDDGWDWDDDFWDDDYDYDYYYGISVDDGDRRATPTPVAQPDEAESVDEEEEEDIDEEEEEDGDEEEEEAEEPTRACPAIREADACPEEVDIAPCDAVGLADMYVVAGVGVDLVVVLDGVTAEEFRKTSVAERFADAVAAVLDVPPAAVGAPVASDARRRLQEAAARSCRVDFVVEVEEDRDVEADFARAVEAKALDDARGRDVSDRAPRRRGRRDVEEAGGGGSSRPSASTLPVVVGAAAAAAAVAVAAAVALARRRRTRKRRDPPDLESAASEEVKLDDEPSPYSPRLSWKTRKARLGRSFAWDDAAGAGWVSWARDDALGLQFVRRFDARGRLELVDARVGCAVGAADAATRLDLEDSGSWPFAGRVAALRSTLEALRIPWQTGRVSPVVTRGPTLLQDCFDALGGLRDDQWRWPFFFKFAGEPGLDAGGVGRECLRLATSAIFATHFGLFKCAEGDALTYTVQDDAAVAAAVEGGARWLNFAGKLVGKALLDGAHLDAHLNRCLLKHVCGEPLSLVDLGWLDETLLKSLSQLRDIDVGGLELTFSVDESAFGAVRSRDLVEGGSSKAVTEANKEEFIELRLRDALFETSKEGIEAFLSRASTPSCPSRRTGATSRKKGADHDVVRWFWDAVRAMDGATRSQLLQWTTGHGRVPVQGFSHLMGRDGALRPFTLTSVALSAATFTRAHTCFNRIDLPLYEDPEKLAAAIKFVLEFGDETFSMD